MNYRAERSARRPDYRKLRVAAEFVVALAFMGLAYGCWMVLP